MSGATRIISIFAALLFTGMTLKGQEYTKAVGVDYTLGFIQFALDWRPEWTIINNFGTQLGYDVGFAIRLAIP